MKMCINYTKPRYQEKIPKKYVEEGQAKYHKGTCHS